MLPPRTPRQAIDATVREEWGRILASLVKSFGDFQLAEDCLQDAIARALEVWPDDGMPRSPAAWLITTARRRAIDRFRRDARFAKRRPELSHLMDLAGQSQDVEPDVIPDKRLEMIFTCCHPALEQKTQVALTLRTLGGLSTDEIAQAFLDKPETMAQRLVRAKRKISAAGIPYKIPQPDMLPDRISAVLSVIYLIFNAGYTAASSGSSQLSDEAIRLARIVRNLLPDHAEVSGLLALMLIHDSRRLARVDNSGQMVPLDAQNRNRWNRAQIAEGDAILHKILPRGQVGPYQLQSAISALHAQSPRWDATDWSQIAALYQLLYQMQPSPVVRINHAMAVSYAVTVHEAIAMLNTIADDPQVLSYQPYHTARADLAERLGHADAAKTHYARAIALTEHEVEKAFLQTKHDAI